MGRQYSWNYRPPQSPGPDVPKHRSAKDTRRWCKGVVGREHVLVWRQCKFQAQNWGRREHRKDQAMESEEVCEGCGKEGLGRRVSDRYWSRLLNTPRPYGPAF